MKLKCSNCSSELKPENINISTDLAKCDNCGSILKVSELTSSITSLKTTPPNGSKIMMTKGAGGQLELTLPKKGFSASVIPQFIFATFWLAFISFWTWGASQGSVIFAMFSLPFWLVGISMITGVINSINEVQKITLNKQILRIDRIRPIGTKSFETVLTNVQTIKLKGMKMNPFAMFGNFRYAMKTQTSLGSPIETPAIITGMKTEHFFEDANDAEQEWVSKFLDTLVKQMNK